MVFKITIPKGNLPAGIQAGKVSNMNINDIRRENLKHLIDTRYGGVIARLANQLDKQPAYISRCLTGKEEHRRNIGEKLAREIEEKTGLHPGWMDEVEHLYPKSVEAPEEKQIPEEVQELINAVLDTHYKGALSLGLAKAHAQVFRALSASSRNHTEQRGPQLDENGKVIMGNEPGVEEAIFTLNEQPQKKVG